VEEKIVPHQERVLLEEVRPAVDTATYTPLKGGISVGPCRSFHLEPPEVETAGDYVFTGTLGCIVRDRASGAHMMLSNFHVMCVDDTWAAGDDMAQPSLVDTGQCPRDRVGDLQRAQLNQDVDAAVASIDARPYDCEIVGIGPVPGTAAAAVDMQVRKRGRTTDLTNGRITSIDYTTTVDYGDGLGAVTLRNQIRIVPDGGSAFFGKKGDSGSVVVDGDSNVVGLYFAGNTTGTVGVANPIQRVLDALNVDVCVKPVIKKIEQKELIKDFDKQFIEKHFWQEKGWRGGKEFFKDWKEWAYEKGDIDGKFVAFEGDPWGRIPVDPRVVQPPVSPFAAPQAVVAQADVTGPCVDLTGMTPGLVANPLALAGATLTKHDFGGTTPPQGRILQWGALTGWDCGFTAEIEVPGCPMVGVTVAHFARPATVEAFNADGTPAGSATTSAAQNTPHTLWFVGTSITRLVIHCPQNETLLVRICCCERPVCGRRPDKHFKEFGPKELKEQQPKEFGPKELKEQQPKEFKEPKELKEQQPKEFKEPKELKEQQPKEFKEPKEIVENPGGPVAQPPIMGGAPDQGHFIPPHLRPDLGRGALRSEPDLPYQG
jgi:hypothetical protein